MKTECPKCKAELFFKTGQVNVTCSGCGLLVPTGELLPEQMDPDSDCGSFYLSAKALGWAMKILAVLSVLGAFFGGFLMLIPAVISAVIVWLLANALESFAKLFVRLVQAAERGKL